MENPLACPVCKEVFDCVGRRINHWFGEHKRKRQGVCPEKPMLEHFCFSHKDLYEKTRCRWREAQPHRVANRELYSRLPEVRERAKIRSRSARLRKKLTEITPNHSPVCVSLECIQYSPQLEPEEVKTIVSDRVPRGPARPGVYVLVSGTGRYFHTQPCGPYKNSPSLFFTMPYTQAERLYLPCSRCCTTDITRPALNLLAIPGVRNIGPCSMVYK